MVGIKNKKTDKKLGTVYQIKPEVNFKVVKKQVIVLKDQDFWLQRFLRKLFFKIPQKSEIKLDPIGSFIFQAIDGKRTVEELGVLLSEAHEDATDKLYERLTMYLHHLEEEERWIERIDEM